MKGPFDELMKYKGDDFQVVVIQALNMLYHWHVEAKQENDKDHSRLANTVDTILQGLEGVKGQMQGLEGKVNAFEEKWRETLNRAIHGESTH